MTLGAPASSFSRNVRTMPRAETYRPRQPLLPHLQGLPCRNMFMWPISPALAVAP